MMPIIVYSDFNKLFILYTDALGRSVRTVLHQKGDDRKEQIIACANRTFNKYEKKYPITKQKCLAVMWGVEKFKQYLCIKSFKIVTDHIVLETICTIDLPSGRRA